MSEQKSNATKQREWALVLGVSIVQVYDTYDDAEGARDWYVKTYGPPAQPLRVEEVEPDAD